MNTKNKVLLANLSIWIMVITISIITIWFIGFIVANTFDLNVFTKRTSTFMISFIGFSAVLVICSAILNISLNISIIADSRAQQIKSDSKSVINKKLLFITLAGIIFLIIFLFTGDYLTRLQEKDNLYSSADYIVQTYSKSIDKIALGLNDTSYVSNIPRILGFLSNQKSEFPYISLITSDIYDGQLTFLKISNYQSKKELKEPYFGNSFYKCREYDCDYLKEFFTGNTKEPLFWTFDNDYKLYYPFERNGRKFILLFTKYRQNGKFGS